MQQHSTNAAHFADLTLVLLYFKLIISILISKMLTLSCCVDLVNVVMAGLDLLHGRASLD